MSQFASDSSLRAYRRPCEHLNLPMKKSVFIRVYPWLKFSSPATRQMTGIATSRCCDLFLVPMDKYD
jgi:hypothetical protein